MTEETRTFWRTQSGRGKLHLRPECRKGLVPVELTATEWEQSFFDLTQQHGDDRLCIDCASSDDAQWPPLTERVVSYRWAK